TSPQRQQGKPIPLLALRAGEESRRISHRRTRTELRLPHLWHCRRRGLELRRSQPYRRGRRRRRHTIALLRPTRWDRRPAGHWPPILRTNCRTGIILIAFTRCLTAIDRLRFFE